MDTGSTGIVASADIFQPGPDAVNLGPGSQTYSSSGVIEVGTWYSATQNIYDSNGNLVATADVPVLQVTSIKCEQNARNCTPNDHPTGVSNMGVGFARESGGRREKPSKPDYNAFLNLTSVAGSNGTLRAGARRLAQRLCRDPDRHLSRPDLDQYRQWGAGEADAGRDQLAAGLPEWKPAPMMISLNGATSSGNVLMDTGLTTGYLSDANYQGSLAQCPGQEGGDSCLPSGSMVALSLPGAGPSGRLLHIHGGSEQRCPATQWRHRGRRQEPEASSTRASPCSTASASSMTKRTASSAISRTAARLLRPCDAGVRLAGPLGNRRCVLHQYADLSVRADHAAPRRGQHLRRPPPKQQHRQPENRRPRHGGTDRRGGAGRSHHRRARHLGGEQRDLRALARGQFQRHPQRHRPHRRTNPGRRHPVARQQCSRARSSSTRP